MDDKVAKRVLLTCGTKFHSDYVAEQLYKHGILERLVTSHPKQRYINRTNIPANKLKFLFPIFVIPYFLRKLGSTLGRLATKIDYMMPALFDDWAAKYTKAANVSITWSWSGLKTIKRIKEQGGISIVEECGSCNIEQNRLLTQEYNSLGLNFYNPTPEHILKREMAEVNLADYILCPSKYVAESFVKNGILREKCIIIPYGVNLSLFKDTQKKNNEFTILFVGTIGVRKGLIHLFKALEIVNKKYKVKCQLIGSIEDSFKPVFEDYKHLIEHNCNLTQTQLAEYYNEASIFVFPSLDEGMAYVQLEAMACGLPVICTPNSGGDSVITDGQEGFIVPIRDSITLAEKIIYLKENTEVLARMSEAAAAKAKEFTWDAYGNKLANFINGL